MGCDDRKQDTWNRLSPLLLGTQETQKINRVRMMGELEDFFRSKVDIPLIRHGERQRIGTLINEEALLLEKYLRDERKEWTPRIAVV